MGYGPLRLDMYCTVFFLVFTWHGMPIHLCAHSIGPCSWTPTAARPWQEVVFLVLFQCISRVGVGWGMLTFLVSGTQRNWRVGLGWGGVGHVLTFMWTCGERKCFSVAAGRWIYARLAWGGVGHVLTFMWTCGGRTCFSVATVRSLEPSMHASCYATVSSLELSTHASCHAIVSSLELSTHASCHAIVSSLELSTNTSCHAIVSSLEPSMHVHATLLYRD